MSEPASMRLKRWLLILLGGVLLLGLLTACFRAYLRPDFLLELVSSNLMC